MKNNLKSNFLINFCFLATLALAGCTHYRKAELGLLETGNQSHAALSKPELLIPKKDAQLVKERSNTEVVVDTAGAIGGATTSVAGGTFGSLLGGFGGGWYAACTDSPIGQGIGYGAAKGWDFGYTVSAPIGRHTVRMATFTLIKAGSYGYQTLKWATSHAYSGINSIYNHVMTPPEDLTDVSDFTISEPKEAPDYLVIEPNAAKTTHSSSEVGAKWPFVGTMARLVALA
ncbi:hypothetical protein [Candidatus Cardinium sp. cByotN1]|uniref:hypothetical protein n=1 Tax=Candidatus Cardinium sp. cByotN1 TaxID=2699439 RepID=UPI001FB2D201|nr:hypothetical protein [Candidatus Cardinium sp. cByotN1]